MDQLVFLHSAEFHCPWTMSACGMLQKVEADPETFVCALNIKNEVHKISLSTSY